MAVPRHAYVYLTMLYYTRVGCRIYIQVSSGNHHNGELPLLQGLCANTFPALAGIFGFIKSMKFSIRACFANSLLHKS